MVRVTEGTITVNVWPKSRGNRFWFELARVRVIGSRLYIRLSFQLCSTIQCNTTRLIEFTCRTSQVRVEPESSTSQVRVRIQLLFLFLFISSDCYSVNDVQVLNGKINFQVCNIFQYRSLEPLLLWFAATAERYATSLCVHNIPKKIKTCSCIHLKQKYHFHDWKNGRRWKTCLTKAPSCWVHRTPMQDNTEY